MNHNLPTPFVWGDIELSQTLIIDGTPHATKTAIGEWLEYADPRVAINKILGRNPHVDDYSVDVKLTSTDGKKYDSRVYHPIGFLLIVMKSGQPKAEAMNRAVAEFVWHFAGPRKRSFRAESDLRKQRIAILSKLATVRDVFVQQALLDDLRTVSLELGRAVPDVALLGTDTKQLALEV